MSYEQRIKVSADAILAADDWDKKLGLAHLLGELGSLGKFADHRAMSVDQLADSVAGACERTVRMLAIGRQVEADE